MPTTKIYSNTSKKDLDVIGVGVVPAGDQVSITAEFQPPVVLANYPGLVDLTNEAPSAPVAPAVPDVPTEPSGGQNEQG